MERLPFHLFDLIIMLISLDDVFNCLSVNKAWRATFTPYAYEVVYIKNITKIEQFMESMTLYPRCREEGKYIKALNLNDGQYSKKRFSEAVEKHLVSVLSNCPHIESLELKHTKATFQAILDPRVSPYPRLKRLTIGLDFDRRFCCRRYLKKCYLKFRSSLECTSFYGLHRNQFKANNIRLFIVLFPHFNRLELADCTYLALDKILIDCPSLTSITIDDSLSIPDDAQISSHKCPLMKDLRLNCSVALKSIEYITRRFPCLKNLWLESISNRHMDESIEILLKKDDSELHLGLNPTSLLQLYKREQFYKWANIGIVNMNDSFNAYSNFQGTIAIFLWTRRLAGKPQRLREIGQFLNSLQLASYYPPSELGGHYQIMPCSIRAWTELTTLEVRNIRITDLTFRNIESAFPKLQSLTLDSIDLHEAVNPHTFLSKNGLRSLKIERAVAGLNLVLKVQGVPVRSWHAIKETKKIWITEEVYQYDENDDSGEILIVDKQISIESNHFVETNGSDGVLSVMKQLRDQLYLVIEASSMNGVNFDVNCMNLTSLKVWKGNY
ncbi:hypothetical protein BDB01DRAFT_885093 [Pilobolus umbonatus]|nr:hypothetical protein BDB01DRAFT_885093 [Pilobolus umbonatus]